MKHIAIDPCGLGNTSRQGMKKRCWGYTPGLHDCFDVNNINEVDFFLCRAKEQGCDTVIIEDSKFGRGQATKKLAEARRSIHDSALRLGLTVHRLDSNEWQEAMLGKARRGKTKLLSEDVAADIVGYEVKNEDAADAVCMHRFIELNPDFFEETR